MPDQFVLLISSLFLVRLRRKQVNRSYMYKKIPTKNRNGSARAQNTPKYEIRQDRGEKLLSHNASYLSYP